MAQLGKETCHSQVPSHWRGAPPELVFNVSNHRGSFVAVKCEGVTASCASGKLELVLQSDRPVSTPGSQAVALGS